MPTLAAAPNGFGGVVVNADALPSSPTAFDTALTRSLAQWRSEQVKVVWLEVATSRAHLVPAALSQGFEFHHCLAATLVLTKRLVSDAHVPDFATHGIGVGGVVLSDEGQLLTVLERSEAPGRQGYYKLPGGMLQTGEHLADGIVREVREETGVLTACQGLLSLRHHHRGQFARSNIYAVFLLRPLTSEITIDPEEISSARWVPVAEFLADDRVGIYNRHVVHLALEAMPRPSVKLPGYMDGPEAYEIY